MPHCRCAQTSGPSTTRNCDFCAELCARMADNRYGGQSGGRMNNYAGGAGGQPNNSQLNRDMSNLSLLRNICGAILTSALLLVQFWVIATFAFIGAMRGLYHASMTTKIIVLIIVIILLGIIIIDRKKCNRCGANDVKSGNILNEDNSSKSSAASIENPEVETKMNEEEEEDEIMPPANCATCTICNPCPICAQRIKKNAASQT